MLELRFTVFRDKPDSQTLKEYSSNGYNLFHDRRTDLYFLTDTENDDFERKGFGIDYHRVINVPFKYDFSDIKAFKNANKDILQYTLIHDEILIDALALSHTFSTRVLCVYSNDEDCDFAVTAENGKLVRLRFKAGRKQGEQIDNAVARKIVSEIKATKVLMDDELPDDEGVFEYTAFEVIQTGTQPLALYPYWTFREGEISGQVIFETLKSSPEGTAPNLFFRNAFLEFEEAFGKTPPDFTDMPEQGRFARVDHMTPQTPPLFTKIRNSVGSLAGLIFASRKATLWTVGIIFVLSAAIFGQKKETPKKSVLKFTEHCAAAGGVIAETANNLCKLENKTYQNWNLPGELGERRIMILEIEPNQLPCPDAPERKCISIDSVPFDNVIEDFTFRVGKLQIVPVERLQICDPNSSPNCLTNTDMFRFKQLIDLGG